MKSKFCKNQLNANEQCAFETSSVLKKLPCKFSIKLLLLFFIISMASCNKMDVIAPVKPGADDHGFKSLLTKDEFTWEVSKKITLTVIPLQTESELSALLYIKTLDGNTLLTYNTKMYQALQLQFDLPTDQTKVRVVYGSIEKIIDVIGNQISFDFITPIPAQYQ